MFAAIRRRLVGVLALALALLSAALAVTPNPELHRCVWMNRQMAADHSCCPKRRVTESIASPATLERQCCETVSPRALAPSLAVALPDDGLEPPRIEAAVASVAWILALLPSPRHKDLAASTHDHLHRLTTVLRI